MSLVNTRKKTAVLLSRIRKRATDCSRSPPLPPLTEAVPMENRVSAEPEANPDERKLTRHQNEWTYRHTSESPSSLSDSLFFDTFFASLRATDSKFQTS